MGTCLGEERGVEGRGGEWRGMEGGVKGGEEEGRRRERREGGEEERGRRPIKFWYMYLSSFKKKKREGNIKY